jgi:putative transposase
LLAKTPARAEDSIAIAFVGVSPTNQNIKRIEIFTTFVYQFFYFLTFNFLIFMIKKGILTYFTATNLYWKPLLEKDYYKDIVVNSLRFFVEKNELTLYGFVIMPNHMHLLMEISKMCQRKDLQHSLMSFTAHEFKKDLLIKDPVKLEEYYVGNSDREYQFWERNPLPVEIFSREVAEQKLNYIHQNPLHEKWNLVKRPEDYYYSSAKFYKTGIDDFGMLTHYGEYFER